MTEEEAKKKWCPMVRHLSGDQDESDNPCNRVGYGNVLDDGEWNRCIASDCMMWRTGETHPKVKPYVAGYCGLGGKP